MRITIVARNISFVVCTVVLLQCIVTNGCVIVIFKNVTFFCSVPYIYTFMIAPVYYIDVASQNLLGKIYFGLQLVQCINFMLF